MIEIAAIKELSDQYYYNNNPSTNTERILRVFGERVVYNFGQNGISRLFNRLGYTNDKNDIRMHNIYLDLVSNYPRQLRLFLKTDSGWIKNPEFNINHPASLMFFSNCDKFFQIYILLLGRQNPNGRCDIKLTWDLPVNHDRLDFILREFHNKLTIEKDSLKNNNIGIEMIPRIEKELQMLAEIWNTFH